MIDVKEIRDKLKQIYIKFNIDDSNIDKAINSINISNFSFDEIIYFTSLKLDKFIADQIKNGNDNYKLEMQNRNNGLIILIKRIGFCKTLTDAQLDKFYSKSIDYTVKNYNISMSFNQNLYNSMKILSKDKKIIKEIKTKTLQKSIDNKAKETSIISEGRVDISFLKHVSKDKRLSAVELSSILKISPLIIEKALNKEYYLKEEIIRPLYKREKVDNFEDFKKSMLDKKHIRLVKSSFDFDDVLRNINFLKNDVCDKTELMELLNCTSKTLEDILNGNKFVKEKYLKGIYEKYNVNDYYELVLKFNASEVIKLNDIQLKILIFIKQYKNENHKSPLQTEIANFFNISPFTVCYLIKQLSLKGYIKLEKSGQTNIIRILKEDGTYEEDKESSMLTKRQKDILNFIKEYKTKYDRSPLQTEIAKSFNVSAYTVSYLVKQLSLKGYVKLEKKGQTNIIRLLKEDGTYEEEKESNILTQMQKDILNFIKDYKAKYNRSPNQSKIAQEFNISEISVTYNVRQISKKGFMQIIKRGNKNIFIISGEEAIKEEISSLTNKETEILNFIKNYKEVYKKNPNLNEIKENFNLSESSISKHIRNIEKKGYLKRLKQGTKNNILLLKEDGTFEEETYYLTDTQKKILDFIKQYKKEKGFTPTTSIIGKELDIKIDMILSDLKKISKSKEIKLENKNRHIIIKLLKEDGTYEEENKILTDKQIQMLEFIKQYKEDKRYSPSQKQIGISLNFTSLTISKNLKALEEKGYLKISRQGSKINIQLLREDGTFEEEYKENIMLTKKQEKILNYIKQYNDENNNLPTPVEISKKFKISVPNTMYYLKVLDKKEYIKIQKNPNNKKTIYTLCKNDSKDIDYEQLLSLLKTKLDSEEFIIARLLFGGCNKQKYTPDEIITMLKIDKQYIIDIQKKCLEEYKLYLQNSTNDKKLTYMKTGN